MAHAVYLALFDRISSTKTGKDTIITYALTANAASFLIGLIIAEWIPGFF